MSCTVTATSTEWAIWNPRPAYEHTRMATFCRHDENTAMDSGVASPSWSLYFSPAVDLSLSLREADETTAGRAASAVMTAAAAEVRRDVSWCIILLTQVPWGRGMLLKKVVPKQRPRL